MFIETPKRENIRDRRTDHHPRKLRKKREARKESAQPTNLDSLIDAFVEGMNEAVKLSREALTWLDKDAAQEKDKKGKKRKGKEKEQPEPAAVLSKRIKDVT